MSAIFGVIRAPGALVHSAELAKMADVLKHRGPDGIRYSELGNAGLGHCKLCSTPESQGELLPFREPGSGLYITSDTRIDNRRQLLADIPLSGGAEQDICDSQLILHAYLRWGENCVDHLLGDFAFAIWDEHRQSLFIARDHMGCKPLYYHCDRGLFVFASTALAVKAAPGVPASIDRARVADCLVEYLEGFDNTSTFFDSIFRLPPGHRLSFSSGRVKSESYWAPTLGPGIRYSCEDEYLEAFSEIFEQAVADRLRAYHPPAAMLSGGVDSSAVCVAARGHLRASGGAALTVFSAIDDSIKCCQEAFHARMVVEQGGMDHHEIIPGDIQRLYPALESWRSNLEDPFDFEMIVHALVYRSASQKGHRVVLDGLDGDLVTGLPDSCIGHMVEEGRWREAWNEAGVLAAARNDSSLSLSSILFRACMFAYLPGPVRNARRRTRLQRAAREAVEVSPISDQFADEVDLAGRIDSYERRSGIGCRADAGESHRLTLGSAYLTAAVERYERVGAAYGVDARHPLLDKRVIEFVLNIPRQQKFGNGWSKRLLRRLMEQYQLPHIAWRAESNHPGNIFHQHWLNTLRAGGLSLAKFGGFENAVVMPDTRRLSGQFDRDYMEMRTATLLQWLDSIN